MRALLLAGVMFAHISILIGIIQAVQPESCTSNIGNEESRDSVNKVLYKLRDIRSTALNLLKFFRKNLSTETTVRIGAKVIQQVDPERVRYEKQQVEPEHVRNDDNKELEVGLRMLMPLEGEIVHTVQHHISWEVLLPPNSDAHILVVLDDKVRYQAWLNCSFTLCGTASVQTVVTLVLVLKNYSEKNSSCSSIKIA
jgi:hypothetical protein